MHIMIYGGARLLLGGICSGFAIDWGIQYIDIIFY